MKNVKLDLEVYKKVLRTHYAVMYVLGQREALENMATAAKAQKGPVATANSKPKTNAQGMPIFDPSFTINWDAWTPGNEAAAALLDEPGGLKDLLGNIDIQARGIADYSHDLLGRALADGIARGDTPVTIANDIRDSLSAPERALTIAITEGQRAKISANLDSYQANGVEQIEWTVNDPDDADCLDNEGEIVNMGDQFPSGDTQPPVHPNCQCDVIPVMPDLSGTPEYSDQPVDEGDDSEMAVRADLEKYSETQERDSHGRFGSGSGESSTAGSAGKEALNRAQNGKQIDVTDFVNGERSYEGDLQKMGEVIHAQGWNAPSQVLSSNEFDKLKVSGDFVTVYRGGPAGLQAGLTSGQPWIGDGNAGPGTYTTTDPERATAFASLSQMQTGGSEKLEMLVPKSMIDTAPNINNTPANPLPSKWSGKDRADYVTVAASGKGAYESSTESSAKGDYVIYNTSALIIRGQ
jgi:SPP1 gp7 family putative phage head morphogenesis protein